MSSGNRKQLLLTHGLNISLNWLACDMLIRHYRCITDDGSQTKFKQMYISTIFSEPKLIAGTSPTLIELRSIDPSIYSQSNWLKLKSVSAQSLLNFQSFSFGRNNANTSPHYFWHKGLSLSHWSIYFPWISCYSSLSNPSCVVQNTGQPFSCQVLTCCWCRIQPRQIQWVKSRV